jgi:hypothetical protein
MKKYFIAIIFMAIVFLPQIAIAQTPACTPGATLCNPLATHGNKISSFPQFVIFMLQVFAGVGGIAAIVYVTFAGFRFLISQGKEEDVSKAKAGLQWTLTGLVIMMLSYVIVIASQTALKWTGVPTNPNELKNPININNFVQLYRTVIEGFFGIMALVAILMIVVSGYRYITAGGNEEQTHSAKNGLKYAVIGVAISLLAYVIVHSVGVFFGRD